MVEAGGISAVVLAAGQSRRMGQPKKTLPWGDQTVIQKVVGTLREADIEDIVVITGGAREGVERSLAGEVVRTGQSLRIRWESTPGNRYELQRPANNRLPSVPPGW